MRFLEQHTTSRSLAREKATARKEWAANGSFSQQDEGT